MTRRLVPLLFVALVVLAGCAGTSPTTTSPATDAATDQPTEATTTTEASTQTTTSDSEQGADDESADSDSSNDTDQAADADTPPGIDLNANESDVVANASALLDAHETALLADGFRAQVESVSDYGQGAATNVTGWTVVGPDADRFNATVTVIAGNRSRNRALWGNRSLAVSRTEHDGDVSYQNVQRGYLTGSFTATTMLSGTLTELNFSVANVSERDGTTYYTLAATRTVNRSTDVSVDARMVVDESGVVHAYRMTSVQGNDTTMRSWELLGLGAEPEQPDWVEEVSSAARLNTSVYANVQRDRYPNPNGTGYVQNHSVLTVTNSGPDALPAGTNVSITFEGTTHTAVLDEPMAGDSRRYFALVDGELTGADSVSAFDDTSEFAENVTVRVAFNGTSLYEYTLSYRHRTGDPPEDRDDEQSPNATKYAPGVTSDGIVYAERLLEAHTEALVASGFEVTAVQNDFWGENASVLSTDTERTTVIASTNRTDVLERVEREDGTVVEYWKQGRYRYVHVESPNATFLPRDEIDTARSLTQHGSMMRTLEIGDFEVTAVEERQNTTFVTLEATTAEPPYNGTAVESFDATVVVDEDGRVHRFEANTTYVNEDDGSVWGENVTFELVRTGDVDPERPAWMDDVPENAAKEMHLYPHVRNRSRITLQSYGEDPVPAGTSIVVTVDGERYETTLDDPVESRDVRFAYIVDGELRVTDDRTEAVGERIVEPTHVRIVTADGVLLMDDELYLPDRGNESATVLPSTR